GGSRSRAASRAPCPRSSRTGRTTPLCRRGRCESGVRSLAASHLERKRAVLREARVVLELRDLEPSERQKAVLERGGTRAAPAPEMPRLDRGHALYGHHSRIDGAQVDGRAEREVVRMEEAR